MASLACCNGATVLSANAKLGTHKTSSPAPPPSSSLAFFKRSTVFLPSSAASPRLSSKRLLARAEEGLGDKIQNAVDKITDEVKNIGQQTEEYVSGASKDPTKKGDDDMSRQVSRLSTELQHKRDSEIDSAKDKASGSAQGAGDALQGSVDKAKDAASDAASSVKSSIDNLGKGAQ